MSAANICEKCVKSGETKDETGHYGKFLHVRCFDAWWREQYGEMKGVYYRWMRQGMCVR